MVWSRRLFYKIKICQELFSSTAQEIIEDFVVAVVPNFSQEIWDDFNSSFYTTFWLLQTSDLIVPDAAYRKQEAYLKSQIRQTELDNSLVLNGTWFCFF